MMELNEIEVMELEMQKEMDELKKQKEIAMVKEGKAYNCKKCKIFVDKEKISPAPLENGLCSNCFNKKWADDAEKKLVNTLKFAKIVDIELDSYRGITQLTVYKNSTLYDLKPEYDRDFDDNPVIVIDHEYKSNDIELDVDEIKPWQKPRCEKPLLEKKP